MNLLDMQNVIQKRIQGVGIYALFFAVDFFFFFWGGGGGVQWDCINPAFSSNSFIFIEHLKNIG